MEDKIERLNPFCVISKNVFGEHAVRDIQTNSAWQKNPYGDDYAIVPDDMVEDILKTRGYCSIRFNQEETEVASFTPREIPETPKIERKPTTEERLAALEMAMLEQIGVVSE